MTKYEFKKVLKDEEKLIEGFDALTQKVFCFDLKAWRKAGLCQDNYYPNVLVKDGEVIANIGASLMNLQLYNKPVQAVQFGAVGVLPEYRGQGLGKELMKKVLEEYKAYPLKFLFASEDVSQFYLKCGFRRVDEARIFTEVKEAVKRKEPAKITMEAETINRLLSTSLRHSAVVDGRYNESIFKFHLIYDFSNDIYYIEDKDIVFIAGYEGTDVNLFDVLSEKEVTFEDIKEYILKEDTKRVNFFFTPDWLKVNYEVEKETDNSIYVYGEFFDNMDNCRFPETSIT